MVSTECPLISSSSREKAITLGEMSVMHSLPFSFSRHFSTWWSYKVGALAPW